MIRHQNRHAHKTICLAIQARLEFLDWIGDNPPFGATSVTLLELQPEEHGMTVAPNTVAVSFGTEDPFAAEELGGALTSSKIDLFVDVYGEDQSTAMAIASDLRDFLSDREFPLRDFSEQVDGEETNVLLCFEDVFIDVPPAANSRVDRRFWRVVQGGVQLYFSDDRVI